MTEDAEIGYFGERLDDLVHHSSNSYPPHHDKSRFHFPHVFVKRHKEQNVPLLDVEDELSAYHRHDLQTVYEGVKTVYNHDNEVCLSVFSVEQKN